MRSPNGAPGVLAQLRSLVLPIATLVVVPGFVLWRDGHLPNLGATAPWRLVIGALLGAAGLAMLVWTLSLFARIGRGTLAPWDPTRHLVIAGPYAHVRNPMISGVLTILVGETVAFDWHLAVWAGVFLFINHVYFVVAEEPGLVKRFGSEYIAYRDHVPRWIPRIQAYRPGGPGSALRS